MATVWERALATTPPPGRAVVLAAAAVAAVLVLAPRCWPVTRHLVTVAHEGAHGVVALLVGRRLGGIRLHSDTSGVTVSAGRRTGPGMVLTAAAGYVGPALAGLAGAAVLSAGHAVGFLWGLLLLLAALLLQIRNLFGLLVVVVCGAALLSASWWLPVVAQSALAYVVAWFLLLAAPRPVLELAAARRRGRERGSDADQLARLTRLPAGLWVLLFLAATLGALLVGARWLLP